MRTSIVVGVYVLTAGVFFSAAVVAFMRWRRLSRANRRKDTILWYLSMFALGAFIGNWAAWLSLEFDQYWVCPLGLGLGIGLSTYLTYQHNLAERNKVIES